MSLSAVNSLSGLNHSTSEGILGNNSATGLRNEFLQMMVAQIQNQDPLNPLDGAEYVAQLAQFSTVESLENLRIQEQQNGVMLNTLQVLQSAQLVGRQVTVPASSVELAQAETLRGHVDFPEGADSVTLQVYDANGQVVAERFWVGGAEARFDIELPTGRYRLVAEARQGSATQISSTYLQREVEKVSLGNHGSDIRLQLTGVGDLSLFSVTEFSHANL